MITYMDILGLLSWPPGQLAVSCVLVDASSVSTSPVYEKKTVDDVSLIFFTLNLLYASVCELLDSCCFKESIRKLLVPTTNLPPFPYFLHAMQNITFSLSSNITYGNSSVHLAENDRNRFHFSFSYFCLVSSLPFLSLLHYPVKTMRNRIKIATCQHRNWVTYTYPYRTVVECRV